MSEAFIDPEELPFTVAELADAFATMVDPAKANEVARRAGPTQDQTSAAISIRRVAR